jgi:hypothetical protein
LRELGTAPAERVGEGPSKEEQDAETERAEAEMWAWYQEWGTIARMAVSDRSLLRLLGIGRPGRRKGKGGVSAGGGAGAGGDDAPDGEEPGDDATENEADAAE